MNPDGDSRHGPGPRPAVVAADPVVRAASPADAGDIMRVYAPYVTESAVSFEAEPPDEAELARRMLAAPRLPWLVALDDGRVVGYSYASKHRGRAAYRWSVEVSVYLDPTVRSRGVGRALYARLLRELPTLGYVSAFAGVALPNDASERFHAALGFTPVGVFESVGFKRGAWRDVSWWQMRLVDPPPVAPHEPRAWEPAEPARDG